MARDDIWARDGGIYFGRQVADPISSHEEQRLLAKDEDLRNTPTEEEPLRGIWSEVNEDYRYRLDRHVFTVGPNGSGKTRRLLFPNLIKLPNWSMLVVDPKGWLAAHTGPFRASLPNHKVLTIDPFGVLQTSFPDIVGAFPQLRSQGLNPLLSLDPESERFNDDAANMARALIKLDGTHDKYWPQSAQALVKGLLMAIRVEDGADAKLGSLRRLLGFSYQVIAHELRRIVANNQQRYPAIAAALNRFTDIQPDNRELSGIISNAQTQTDWLDSVPMQRSLAGAAFDFGVMKESPTTIYLILPPEELETQSLWLRLMVASALRPLLRSVRPAETPVLFMLDEFAQLGHMDVIEKNLGLMREYGVKLWPVLQDLGQIKDLYEKRWESFIANSGVLHAFAPQDATSRDYLSKLSGEKLYWKLATNQSSTMNAGESDKPSISQGTSSSWHSQKGPICWPQALGAMKPGNAVLFAQGRYQRAYFPQPQDLGDENVRAALALSDPAFAGGLARRTSNWFSERFRKG